MKFCKSKISKLLFLWLLYDEVDVDRFLCELIFDNLPLIIAEKKAIFTDQGDGYVVDMNVANSCRRFVDVFGWLKKD